MSMLSNPLTAPSPSRGRGAPRVPYDATMPVALAIHLFVVGAVVGGMVRFSAEDRLQALLPLGLLGVVFGYALALTRTPDVMSHVAAVWFGAVGAIIAVGLSVYTPVEIVESRGRVLWELAESVGRSAAGSESTRLDDLELLTLLALTIWMLGYTSAWVLYRRGWLAAALVPPAVVLAISLRSASDRPVWPVGMFLFAAVILWARRQILNRQRTWAHRGLRAPETVSLRAVGLALPVALLILGAGSALPVTAPREAVEPVTSAVSESWDTVRDEVARRLGLEGTGSGNYAEFPESFEIGGTLELGKEIVATLDSEAPHYLALRRYDSYDGAGWSSNVDETFRLEGDGASIRVTNVIFAKSQSVALSGAVTSDRRPVAGIVTVVQPKDDLVFTIETFSGASEAVVTVLGWQRIEQPAIDVSSIDVGDLPVDLQALLSELQQAEVAPGASGDDVRFADRTVGDRINRERERLAKYPVETELSLDSGGRLTVELSGRVPNYDDIEAVFVDERMVAGDQYRVLGQQSIADGDALAEAGIAYPEWLASRYLEIPDAVTQRTRSLAETVVIEAGAETPFDQAWAIQEYLQTSFAYELNPPVGENGEDIVDYFLFESKVGRCEQYASAMVVMLRTLDIPSRLVSGYRSSDEVNDDGQYVFREEQAHTWVEVYFPSYGWIPFEPTAGQDRFDYQSDEEPESTPEPEPEVAQATPTPPPTVDVTPTPVAGATPPAPPALVAPDRDSGSQTWILIVTVGVILALGGAFLLFGRRTPRGYLPVAGIYASLLRLGARLGVRSTSSTTPQEFGTALSRALPKAGPSIATIVDAYHWEQFGPPAEREARLGRAREAWRLVRQGRGRYRLPRRSG